MDGGSKSADNTWEDDTIKIKQETTQADTNPHLAGLDGLCLIFTKG